MLASVLKSGLLSDLYHAVDSIRKLIFNIFCFSILVYYKIAYLGVGREAGAADEKEGRNIYQRTQDSH